MAGVQVVESAVVGAVRRVVERVASLTTRGYLEEWEHRALRADAEIVGGECPAQVGEIVRALGRVHQERTRWEKRSKYLAGELREVDYPHPSLGI